MTHIVICFSSLPSDSNIYLYTFARGRESRYFCLAASNWRDAMDYIAFVGDCIVSVAGVSKMQVSA